MLYFSGDIHGNPIERFSFKHHPELRELTQDDYVFILGDCGVPFYNPDLGFYDYWTRPGAEKAEHYLLHWLNEKPWTTIFIRGNHDNTDLIKLMPWTKLGHADVRQMCYQEVVYDKIYYVDTPQFMYLQGQKLLIIPGAESHDADYIFDYDDPLTKGYIKTIEKKNANGEDVWYRVNHVSWWEDEGVDQELLHDLIPKIPQEVDYVLSHAPCGKVREFWKFPDRPAREYPAPSEQIMADEVCGKIDYKLWLHGHFHHHIELPQIMSLGIYHEIYSLEDIEMKAKWMKAEWQHHLEIMEANKWLAQH